MKLRCFTVCLVAMFGVVRAAADVAVELADGTSPSGTLAKLTEASLELVVGESASRSIGIREVRAVTWRRGDEPAPKPRAVRVTLVDGSVLDGDDLAVSEKSASVIRDGRTIAIARESIETAEFRGVGVAGVDGAGGDSTAWMANLREVGQERGAASDVVVVGSADKSEFVECAIVAVTPEAVSVLLDDETIRVKRSKVIGLKWLRQRDVGQAGNEGPPPAAVVEFDGGRLLARRITIEGDEVMLGLHAGEPIHLPASVIRRIDYAAGRTVSLVSLPPERVEIEPWFGLFRSVDALAGHFEPRKVAVAGRSGGGSVGSDSRQGLRLRPRTLIEWRLPEHARSISMTLAESSSLVVVSIDGREAYRGQPATPVSVVADATGGRRVTITVDFPPSGPGTGGPAAAGVVLVEPVIER